MGLVASTTYVYQHVRFQYKHDMLLITDHVLNAAEAEVPILLSHIDCRSTRAFF